MAGNDGSTGADGGDQNTPVTGGDQGTGSPAATDSSGRVMTAGDAGYVDPQSGQVWNGSAFYNDPAVQIDPASQSYAVPDGYSWGGTSYVSDGGSGAGTGPSADPGTGGSAGTGPSTATATDSAGNVMTAGDAGRVDPQTGQVWNGSAWYNDPAVQIDPGSQSYFVPDTYEWGGSSYVNPSTASQGSGNQGSGNQGSGNQGSGNRGSGSGNQGSGNKQQQPGNQGGRQYAAPGQQSPDGTWGPQVANAAGQFAGAVANTVSPQQPVQQAPQQSWQPPQPTGPQQSYQSQSTGGPQQSGAQQSAAGAPQQSAADAPQQSAAGAPQQSAGPRVGPQKTSSQQTAAQAGAKSSPPAKSNKGLLIFGVVAGLAVVTGIVVWASRPKTPVDPKLAKKPAQPQGHQTASQEHPAHAYGAA